MQSCWILQITYLSEPAIEETKHKSEVKRCHPIRVSKGAPPLGLRTNSCGSCGSWTWTKSWWTWNLVELVDGEVRQSAAPGGEVSLYVSLDLANTIEEADTGSTRGTLS